MGILNSIDQFLGTDQSGAAIDAQKNAASQAQAFQQQAYNDQKGFEKPWQDAGVDALGKMQDPSFQKSFTMADFQADPGYQFAMNQGQQAIQRSAAAKGLQLSGATLKDLTNYGQGMGAQQYQTAYDRFNNDQNTRFSRLGTIAGYGQNANALLSGAAQNFGNQSAGIAEGLGNAQAGADIASGNAASQMFGQMVGVGTMAGMGGFSGGGGGAPAASSGSVSSGMVTGAAPGGYSVGQAGGLYGGSNAGVLFCDERLKCEIRAVSKEDMAELKRTIRPYFFKYKSPEKHGHGEYLGVMTQDLKKSRLGASLVTVDHEGNECIDLHRLLMLFLASQAEG